MPPGGVCAPESDQEWSSLGRLYFVSDKSPDGERVAALARGATLVLRLFPAAGLFESCRPRPAIEARPLLASAGFLPFPPLVRSFAAGSFESTRPRPALEARLSLTSAGFLPFPPLVRSFAAGSFESTRPRLALKPRRSFPLAGFLRFTACAGSSSAGHWAFLTPALPPHLAQIARSCLELLRSAGAHRALRSS